jgi:hypothetical protein
MQRRWRELLLLAAFLLPLVFAVIATAAAALAA